MKDIIRAENVGLFATTNESLLADPSKASGLVLYFHGLNNTKMPDASEEPAAYFAKRNILYAFPYYDPWGWMNAECVAYCDAVADALIEKYGLPADLPVASVGNSMGGMSALVFPMHTRHRVVCVAANSPVCDFVFHATERPDLPRTVLHAVWNAEGTYEEAVRALSPLHNVEKMPDVPYYIIHGDADASVNKAAHPDKLVEIMRERGMDVTYVEVPGMTHCKMDYEQTDRFYAFVADKLGRKE